MITPQRTCGAMALLSLMTWPLLAIALCAAACRAHAADATLGVHVATHHSTATYHTAAPGGGQQLRTYRSSTPGLYLRLDSGSMAGLTVGALRNSFGDPSAYAAWTFETAGAAPGLRAALTLGGITGYKAATVLPLVVPSLSMPVAGGAVRLGYLPRRPKADHAVSAVHLSVEWAL